MSDQKTYIQPTCLQPGDRIAIIAPSSPLNPYQIRPGLEILTQHGLEPVVGDNVRFLRSQDLHAASLDDRLAELLWAWKDDSIAGIIAATGGFGCAQLLPLLEQEYAFIAAHPKVLMGYSDITALNNGLLAKAGLVSFNGPTISVRQDAEEHRILDSQILSTALDLLMSHDVWGERPFRMNTGFPRCVCSGAIVSGPAVGGNLTTFACLLGTRFFPDVTGAIVFLEDIDEGGYELERTLLHLQLAGVFERAAGIVFGEFSRAPQSVEPSDPAIEEVIVEFFRDKGTPCVYGFNFSHGDTGPAAIPIGGWTTLDAEHARVSFDNPFSPDSHV